MITLEILDYKRDYVEQCDWWHDAMQIPNKGDTIVLRNIDKREKECRVSVLYREFDGTTIRIITDYVESNE